MLHISRTPFLRNTSRWLLLDSDIFLTILLQCSHDCLKQTDQIFKTDLFQDVSKGLIVSDDLVSLFSSI